MTGVRFPTGAMMGFLLFATMSMLALEPIQPFLQGVLGALTLGVKHSSVKVNVWSYTSTPPLIHNGMVLS